MCVRLFNEANQAWNDKVQIRLQAAAKRYERIDDEHGLRPRHIIAFVAHHTHEWWHNLCKMRFEVLFQASSNGANQRQDVIHMLIPILVSLRKDIVDVRLDILFHKHY